MEDPIARVTMGNLVAVIYWSSSHRQIDIHDTSRGGFETCDRITYARPFDPKLTVFDIIGKLQRYAERLELEIDEIAI